MSSNCGIIQCLIFISIVYKPVFTTDTTLKLINVVFRHGDRTPSPPLELYPNDPYLNYTFDPPGYGQLTTSGKLRALNLGKFLRNTYDNFLGTDYMLGSVEARSTDISRTKESLSLVLEALYPDALIPMTSEPLFEDSLLLPQLCLNYLLEYLKASEKADVKQTMEELKDFRKKLSEWTGKTIHSAFDMYLIYTTLEAEQFMNLTLPSWTQGVYPDGDLFEALVLEFKLMNYNEVMKKLNGGPLLKKFIEDMKSVRSGSMEENRKIMLYSAHDITVSAALKALDVYYPNAPQFSSAVILELHLINQVYYVKVSYYLGVPAVVKELTIPGCEKLCPLDQFIILMKNVIPNNSDLQCSTIRKVTGFDINLIFKAIHKMKKYFI